MLFPREFALIFSIYYYLNVSTVCPGLKAISSNIQIKQKHVIIKMLFEMQFFVQLLKL